MSTFNQFYERMGFQQYPFRNTTAEKEDTSSLFVAPPDFSIIDDVFKTGNTAIISGNRGTGKTILLEDLRAHASPNVIVSSIENYERVALTDNQLDFYDIILENVVSNTLVYLSAHKKALKKLNSEDKVLLSFLIMKYADCITQSDIQDKIEKVQLSPIKQAINRISAPLTMLINFGTTSVANFGYEVLNRNFSPYLPDVNEGKIRAIIPDIQFKIKNDFKVVAVNYSLLDKTLVLIQKLSGEKPIVLIDRLDEDVRLENDADLITTFIKDLVCDNNLLLNDHVQLFISVWEIPFINLQSIFRKSKHTVFNIQWNCNELENVLNHRLSTYSKHKINDYRTLFDESVSPESVSSIFEISNMNPRDLWSVFDSIFKQQYEINHESSKLSSGAITDGITNFVRNFGFYEYYPQKKNARKNTNDIYTYIKHLLHLNNTNEFTNDELREAASTGGSTTNYISGMMSLGLVNKTDKKRVRGAVIYKVHDPKVSFAIYNKVDISH